MLDKFAYLSGVNYYWVAMIRFGKFGKIRLSSQAFAEIENIIAEEVENQHKEYYHLNRFLVRFDFAKSIDFHLIS